jgi:hypothetical protein
MWRAVSVQKGRRQREEGHYMVYGPDNASGVASDAGIGSAAPPTP